MKALSINQPWAWLIVNGHKAVENRGWDTRYRGEFLIHAGKKFDDDGYEWIKRAFPEISLPEKEDFERGGIVGGAKLIGTVHINDQRLLCERDKPWFFGAYGFILDDARPWAEIKPCKGALGFFTPDFNSKYKEPKAKPAKDELPLFGDAA